MAGDTVDVDEVLARAMGEVWHRPEPTDGADYLRLIATSAQVEAAARRMLHQSVGSARGAGVTWEAVGETLGMSRQAAQKRFASAPAPTADALDPQVRVIGPVTAFDELSELNLAGRHGWHSVGFGAYHHRVVHSDTQWEHARVSTLFGRARTMQADGWQVIGSWFPFCYLKRDLGTPALPE